MSETPRDYLLKSDYHRAYIEAHEQKRGWESWEGKFADIDRIPNSATITSYFDGVEHYHFDPPIQCQAGDDLSMKFHERVKQLRDERSKANHDE